MRVVQAFAAGLWLPGQVAAQTSTDASTVGSDGLMDILFAGGTVGIAIVGLLFALSISAAFLVLDNLLTIRRRQLIPAGLDEAVLGMLTEGRVADARKECQHHPSFLAHVLSSGLAEIDGGWSEAEKAMEDAVSDQTARLSRRIEYLSVIGNIAPMVGLLGTVTGMIFAFQQVANTQGTAGAADLAEGIYQALVTTVGGLLVAIPSLGAYAILRNRVDQLAAEVATTAQHVFAPVRRMARLSRRRAAQGNRGATP